MYGYFEVAETAFQIAYQRMGLRSRPRGLAQEVQPRLNERKTKCKNANSEKVIWKVQPSGFGCMGLNFSYGHALSKEESITLVRQAVDRGVTFFDSSQFRGFGDECYF
jgi:hypothetical protein